MQRLRIPSALLALLCVFALLAGSTPCPAASCSMPMPHGMPTGSMVAGNMPMQNMAAMACCSSSPAVNAPRLCCSSQAQPAELQPVASVQPPTQTLAVVTLPRVLRMQAEQPSRSPDARPPTLNLPLRI